MTERVFPENYPRPPMRHLSSERTAHTRQRALERYGVELTPEAMTDMRRQIREGRAATIAMLSTHKRRPMGIFQVHWADADRLVMVLYRPRSGQLLTMYLADSLYERGFSPIPQDEQPSESAR